MAEFTSAQIDSLVTAANDIATNGFASVSVNGQTTQVKSLDELRNWLNFMKADIAADNPSGGIRITQLVPPGCG